MANASIIGVIDFTLHYQRHYNHQHWNVQLCYLCRLERPCLLASTITRSFKHVYRIPAKCHLLQVTQTL